jgi:hypothetical protein
MEKPQRLQPREVAERWPEGLHAGPKSSGSLVRAAFSRALVVASRALAGASKELVKKSRQLLTESKKRDDRA